jgi:hypothetical protein
VVECSAYLAAVAHAGVCFGGLGGELDGDGGPWRSGDAGLDVVGNRPEAALGDGEPGAHFIGPGHDFAVAGFPAELEGCGAGGFGVAGQAEVVVEAADEQGQPSGDD